ncbi:RNA-directed DNA polymerase, eukaryota, reverse transcriptase zinc-binding domain protein [Tanacetum coccineum]|uniref:RNA-directed DNA polymerase, eukaryota, reverse transcriptase zinc-binding domain protein n=1 Tax=Tanacetum coccineum TaxID=301880 RepID=A0ABQ5G3T4_9ASTR
MMQAPRLRKQLKRLRNPVIPELESLRRAFFWGGSVEDKKIAWVACDKILLPFDKGGLGIISLKSCNLSLLSRWWWRFYNEPNALWFSVIKSIHGDEGGLTNFEAMKVKTGPWFHIARLKEDFLGLNINIDTIFKKLVRNGELTSFWNDRCIGDSPLKFAIGRLYALDTDESCSVSSRYHSFAQALCTDGIGEDLLVVGPNPLNLLNLKSLQPICASLMGTTFGLASSTTKGFSVLVVNILSWRIGQKRLPTRLNLDHRGIDLDSLLCPCCNEDQESAFHLFRAYEVASSLWEAVFSWWGLTIPSMDTVEDIILAAFSMPLQPKVCFLLIVSIQETFQK